MTYARDAARLPRRRRRGRAARAVRRGLVERDDGQAGPGEQAA